MEIVVLYSPLIFNRAGMASTAAILRATVAVGVVKTCFVLVAAVLSDRLGRRPLLLFSTAVTLTSIAIALSIHATSAAVTISVLAFVAAFSVGLGPLVSTYNAERTGSPCPGAFFLLYAGAAVVACVFVYALVPETKGRSLENIDVLFAADDQS
ncbi:hypothetical protein PR202_gb13462 [Eleusine coracana subsp. coracana]|uniref:Major facilitator superfamily (MFS) profile domain-containing protein n=1 Tax=Eleusine coracana subsp. coracana TaxID=191504 RepID=A0AAV5EQK7_ELECO|nr:hypothetical protein PR202_gb13462 [Eleusine coracana subsp. coracana]